MKVDDIILRDTTLDKLLWKHNVSEAELRQAFNNRHHTRRIEKGKVKGEHLYAAIGRTDAGRNLMIFFILKKNRNALIVTARDLTDSERRRYGKK